MEGVAVEDIVPKYVYSTVENLPGEDAARPPPRPAQPHPLCALASSAPFTPALGRPSALSCKGSTRPGGGASGERTKKASSVASEMATSRSSMVVSRRGKGARHRRATCREDAGAYKPARQEGVLLLTIFASLLFLV